MEELRRGGCGSERLPADSNFNEAISTSSRVMNCRFGQSIISHMAPPLLLLLFLFNRIL